uniref:BED-type domain-containing protein n=1 Tax=Heterorhabditis bacteriophora TaxID=37862 RepID=A0A1I7XK50_HETBA
MVRQRKPTRNCSVENIEPPLSVNGSPKKHVDVNTANGIISHKQETESTFNGTITATGEHKLKNSKIMTMKERRDQVEEESGTCQLNQVGSSLAVLLSQGLMANDAEKTDSVLKETKLESIQDPIMDSLDTMHLYNSYVLPDITSPIQFDLRNTDISTYHITTLRDLHKDLGGLLEWMCIRVGHQQKLLALHGKMSVITEQIERRTNRNVEAISKPLIVFNNDIKDDDDDDDDDDDGGEVLTVGTSQIYVTILLCSTVFLFHLLTLIFNINSNLEEIDSDREDVIDKDEHGSGESGMEDEGGLSVWEFFTDLRGHGLAGVRCRFCHWVTNDRSPTTMKFHLKRKHDTGPGGLWAICEEKINSQAPANYAPRSRKSDDVLFKALSNQRQFQNFNPFATAEVKIGKTTLNELNYLSAQDDFLTSLIQQATSMSASPAEEIFGSQENEDLSLSDSLFLNKLNDGALKEEDGSSSSASGLISHGTGDFQLSDGTSIAALLQVILEIVLRIHNISSK